MRPLFLLIAAAAPALAQPRPPALDAAARQAVVDSIAGSLRRHYADADTGRLIAEHLRTRARGGAYDTVTNALRFADLLTRDLQAVNGDRHLYVRYAPASPGVTPGPEGIRMLGPGPRRAAPNAPGGADPARLAHYGMGRADVLPGNVGYLEVRGFTGGAGAEAAVVAALRYLETTDAMIVDLRRNGGGSAEAVNLLLSHFTGDDTLPSLTVTNRSGGERFTRYTRARVPGPRRPTVPLFVLTSAFTASAGEDFAFVARNLGRATVVGGVTAGAGRNNATLDVGHGFGASISFSRVQDPRTGAEWERVGVRPHVVIDQALALDAAHALALDSIAARETDPQRKAALALLGEAARAQAAPRVVAPARLAEYAGAYEGGRGVAVDPAGRLVYTPRPGVPGETLAALSDSTFAMGAMRLAFERDAGRVARLRVTLPDGGSLTFARER